MRIKKARWWDRLGGKPVGHAASPRFNETAKSSIFLTKKSQLKKSSKSCQEKSLKKTKTLPYILIYNI